VKNWHLNTCIYNGIECVFKIILIAFGMFRSKKALLCC